MRNNHPHFHEKLTSCFMAVFHRKRYLEIFPCKFLPFPWSWRFTIPIICEIFSQWSLIYYLWAVLMLWGFGFNSFTGFLLFNDGVLTLKIFIFNLVLHPNFVPLASYMLQTGRRKNIFLRQHNPTYATPFDVSVIVLWTK